MTTREPYQYGWRRTGTVHSHVERQLTKALAENAARDWCISPLRTGPRTAELVRRRGWDGEWETLATWASPEAQR